MKVYSLTDVIKELKIDDVMKRLYMDEFNKIGEKVIEPTIYEAINTKCNKIMCQVPLQTYKYQPKNQKLFLPPIPEVLEQLGTSLEEENEGRKVEEEKRKDETLDAYACCEDTIVLLTTAKNNNKVYYAYSYDYEKEHEIYLMSRIEYEAQ